MRLKESEVGGKGGEAHPKLVCGVVGIVLIRAEPWFGNLRVFFPAQLSWIELHTAP